MEAIHRITRNEGDFVGVFRQNVIRVIGSYGKEQQPDEYTDRIKAKQEEMVALIAENAKTGAYTQEFDERYRRIAEEINALKEEQAEAGKKKKLAENYEQRVKDMDAFLNGNSGQIPEFDNDLVRRLVASIKVMSADGYFIVGAGRDKGMERLKDGFCNGVIGEICDVYGGGFCGWRGYGVDF